MFKKPLTYGIILGLLMIVVGFVFNPSLLEKFTSNGKFRLAIINFYKLF